MRRPVGLSRARRLALFVPAAAVLVPLVGTAPASAATLDVCQSGCPYTQLAPALAAAHSGDTITIGPGTYAGGVTIDVSVKLAGAGPGATIIKGGGPVLTIGVAGAASEPTVTIDGVTVTGGTAIGNLTPFSGRGGGIYIPRAAGPSTGATVTIRNSVIRGNSAAPRVAVESDDPCCPFADSGGGGISNDGTLTLDHTRISGNRADAASGLASSAIGGGILNRAFGTLTLKSSVVTGNRAAASAPNGRFADGGGIATVAGTLTIDDSLISDNSVDLSASLPSEVETLATSGGIHVQGGASATVRRTTIAGNTLTGSNRLGDSIVACGGICTDGSLILRDSTLSDNRVSATTTAVSPAGNAFADSGGLGTGCCQEVPTTVVIGSTRFSGNSVSAAAPAGTALAHGGGMLVGNDKLVPVSDSVVRGNRVSATTTTGSVDAQGAGIHNDGLLTVRNTTVSDNTGTGSGPRGVVQGGGIWNGIGIPGPNLPVQLTLADSLVTHNTLTSASPGITVQGGGLFTMFPVTLRSSVIAQNVPDQCYGC